MNKYKNRRKYVIVTILTVLVLFLIIIAALAFKPLSPSHTLYIYIDTDDTIDSVEAKIESADAGISSFAFNIMAALTGYGDKVQAGRYEVTDKKSTFRLFGDIRGHRSVPVELVVPSVRTADQLAGRLASSLLVDSAELSTMFNDSDTWKSLGRTRETFLALFIPNTYEVYWETPAKRLMRRFESENKAFWTEERKSKAYNIGMTEDEVMTLASIVDSETSDNTEKARIAGLYINRLNHGMLLQSDPTVIFAIGDFSIRRVTGRHLQTDSPYNTYKYHGLPPGPIRIPTIAGIEAVLNYEHNNYLYMCAKEDFSGSHNFAETYSEHMANARKYIKALNERNVH